MIYEMIDLLWGLQQHVQTDTLKVTDKGTPGGGALTPKVGGGCATLFFVAKISPKLHKNESNFIQIGACLRIHHWH